MAPSFDCVSSLLCTEDITLFDDGDNNTTEEVYEQDMWRPITRTYQSVVPVVLPLLQSEDCLVLMMEKENQQWPGSDYLNKLQCGVLNFGARKEAIDWIQKVGAHFGFGPLCEYLSINYLDRFLSAYELPKGRAWTMQLLAVACLSLAAKIEETDVPLMLDLQIGESKFVFEAKTIQRMELLVLSTLKWRMQAVTPFSFIDYFLSKINDVQGSLRSLISQSTQLILTIVKGIDSLEFKPSEIAAAVAMCVVGETEFQSIDSGNTISVLTQHVEKERLLKCVKMIQDLSLSSLSAKDSSLSNPCVPQSPMGVLDAVCFSYKSDNTNGGSCSSSHNNSPDAKRRKLNKNCGAELL